MVAREETGDLLFFYSQADYKYGLSFGDSMRRREAKSLMRGVRRLSSSGVA